MTEKSNFRTISVTGAHSKVGKTTLCTILLENLKGFGAIKFTKTPFYTSVTDDLAVINQKNTDTAKMSRAGAEKVVWIQDPGEGLEDALNIALSGMTGLAGVVVEGNSPVDFLAPHLLIFITGEDGQIKPSAMGLSKRADIIVVNSETQIKDPPISASLLKENTEVFSIDLKNRKGEVNGLIACVNKIINK